MMGSRYRSTRRSPWSHNNNNERWQPRSNVSSFGYRRHELAEKPSTSTFRENTSEEAPAYGESYSDTYFRRPPRGDFQSQKSYDSDSGDIGHYCPPSNARHSVDMDYEIHDLVKAASDTDFRFSSSLHRTEEERRQFPDRNPYRAVPATAQEQRQLVPILKKTTSNPWKAASGDNDPTRRDLGPAHPQNPNSGSAHSGPFQRAPNAASPPSGGLLPLPNLARPRTPSKNSCPDSIPVWDTPPYRAHGNRGYFEALRQREQERNMFGKSHGPQSTFQREQPPVGASSQTLAFSSSSNGPTFSNYGKRDSDTQASQNATGPVDGPHPRFQGTWRGRGAERGRLSNRWRGARSGCQHTPGSQPHRRPNGTSAERGPESAGSRKTRRGVNDARLLIERKRRCASEEDSEESLPPPHEDQPTVSTSGCTQLSSKMALIDRTQHDTKRWIEDHFSENDPAPSHTSDVHEVDESRLWPPDVSPEAVSYVIFLDIDRRSFFDEAKQPFLPGTLLYLFYGDPSVLLPTKEHPFYKDNKGNWVHFYPDCGTEYGSYLVAAPAVISWMDQKVPQGIKFLVHGHRKQMDLDGVSRKIVFYPTSRTVDVSLLNRMLRGDFDVPKPPKAAAPTAIKTIVIKSTTAAAAPPPPPTLKNKPSPNLVNKSAPFRPPLLPCPRAPAVTAVAATVVLQPSWPNHLHES
ncbi:uncharacterized protein LOC144094114 isoform X2 [Amblyomma americanum]